MDLKGLARRIEEEIQSVVEREGVELLGVELVTESGRRVLRVYIDSPMGVSLKDCERVSKAIDPILDRIDLIEGRYFLEVSSPGIERPLFKMKDYERFKGEIVKINTNVFIEGRRNFTGKIKAAGNTSVVIETDSGDVEIAFENINKAKLVVKDWSVEAKKGRKGERG
ncbi:MAG: ribosome maturation factor RimP [Synergistetes bacterium]|nr:ribosome maturation factor RimP [Synergistota bacterium]MDW8192570.1 ribosome maturation factor RimP [Synergistota bacterium]